MRRQEIPPVKSRLNRIIGTGLAGFGMVAGLSGCGDEDVYRAIRVPEGAKYLGISDNDSGGRHSEGPGKSFLIHEDDAARVYCGYHKLKVSIGPDFERVTSKEVRVLSNGLAQITCHGASEDDFPVEYFSTERSVVDVQDMPRDFEQ